MASTVPDASISWANFLALPFVPVYLILRMTEQQLLHLGGGIIGAGVLCLTLAPRGSLSLLTAGVVLLGLGCAPIYPQMTQLTPSRFGAEHASRSWAFRWLAPT